jgi:endonuclease YncB( thermonuclease family)
MAPPVVTEPPTTAAPQPEPAPAATPEPNAVVTHVVDGDTVDLASGERVRVIGIDTPERGQCGYHDAAAAMSDLVQGRGVVVTSGAVDDQDRYGRILRYVDVDGTDAGLAMIQGGFAIARYDSRDGYGHIHGRSSTSPPTRARRSSAPRRRPLPRSRLQRVPHRRRRLPAQVAATPIAPRPVPLV